MQLPKFWFPVDFYISCSGSQKRTLHVPHRVVDLWGESKGGEQKAVIFEVHLLVHVMMIIDLQLSRNLKFGHGFITGIKGRSSPISRRQPPDQGQPNRHAFDNCHAAGHQPDRTGD